MIRRVVVGDHGCGHGAGPALGVGEPGAVPGACLEFEGVPPEEDVGDPALPGEHVRRADLGQCRSRSRLPGRGAFSQVMAVTQTGLVSERLGVREIDDDEGMQMPAIAKVAFTSQDRVRDVIRDFNADGFSALYPKYPGGRLPKFTLRQRREIKKIARSRPAERDLPFSVWSLSKLAGFLAAEGVAEDISHEGLRTLLREEGVSFQRVKTWKASKDPRYRQKKARVEHLYAIADREAAPAAGEPRVARPRSCASREAPCSGRAKPRFPRRSRAAPSVP